MKNRQNPAKVAADKKLWQKTSCANLICYVPSGIYFCRVRVRGNASAGGSGILPASNPLMVVKFSLRKNRTNIRICGEIFSTEKDREGDDASAQHPLPFASQLLQ